MDKSGRKGFQDLLAAAGAGAFDCIVLYDFTRGAHDVVDWLQFHKDMMPREGKFNCGYALYGYTVVNRKMEKPTAMKPTA